jgi:hypothetical protein
MQLIRRQHYVNRPWAIESIDANPNAWEGLRQCGVYQGTGPIVPSRPLLHIPRGNQPDGWGMTSEIP